MPSTTAIPRASFSRFTDSQVAFSWLPGTGGWEAAGVPSVEHYMKLGGKFLGFNVDAKFSNVLDGLLMVDLREAKPELLARYLGKEGAAEFLRLHRAKSDAATSAPAARR